MVKANDIQHGGQHYKTQAIQALRWYVQCKNCGALFPYCKCKAEDN